MRIPYKKKRKSESSHLNLISSEKEKMQSMFKQYMNWFSRFPKLNFETELVPSLIIFPKM